MSQALGEETKKVLRELGLTTYETAVYLCLVEGGVMAASEISNQASVPFSKVYEVLNNLERKGWIDVERGRPTRYFAKPPIEAFETAKRKLNEQIQIWEKAIVEDFQPLYEKREVREKPDIWILRGQRAILAKLQEMLAKVRTQVMIAAPLFIRDIAKKATPLLLSLKLTDAQILVMVTGDPEDWELEALSHFAQLRTRDNMFGGGVIADGKEALLFLGEEDKPNLVVWSNHLGLVKFAKDYFQYLWNSSKNF